MYTKLITVTDPLENASELTEAAQILKRGGLVVFPTETVYGLGGNGLDSDAAKIIPGTPAQAITASRSNTATTMPKLL